MLLLSQAQHVGFMDQFDHEKLDVYRVALDFVILANELCNTLKGRASLCDQLHRASTSITNNIAEGAGEFSRAEKRRFGSSSFEDRLRSERARARAQARSRGRTADFVSSLLSLKRVGRSEVIASAFEVAAGAGAVAFALDRGVGVGAPVLVPVPVAAVVAVFEFHHRGPAAESRAVGLVELLDGGGAHRVHGGARA